MERLRRLLKKANDSLEFSARTRRCEATKTFSSDAWCQRFSWDVCKRQNSSVDVLPNQLSQHQRKWKSEISCSATSKRCNSTHMKSTRQSRVAISLSKHESTTLASGSTKLVQCLITSVIHLSHAILTRPIWFSIRFVLTVKAKWLQKTTDQFSLNNRSKSVSVI